MNLIDQLKSMWVVMWPDLASHDDLQRVYDNLAHYASGEQPKQIAVKQGQQDYNIVLNFLGLAVNRSVSMIVGSGVEFDFDDSESPEAKYIADAWNSNRRGILLHNLAWYGAVYGTCYVKLLPEGIESKAKPNTATTRLVALSPRQIRIATDPEDGERVMLYRNEFVYKDDDDREVARREDVERVTAEDGSDAGSWTITNYVANAGTGGRWTMTSVVPWDYEFAPIVHWQNLPDPERAYGQSDIRDVLGIQDKSNFTLSDTLKTIDLHAHPRSWARDTGTMTRVSWGADEMPVFTGQNATVGNLEMQSDLSANMAFSKMLRQAIFDLTRTIDISSMADRVGQLTNFGLRVLFMDALAKNATKQMLYTDGLWNVNHALLTLGGFSDASAGTVRFADPLPVDRAALVTAEVAAVGAGLESKETGAENIGIEDWEAESERITADKAGETNIGSVLLGEFARGR